MALCDLGCLRIRLLVIRHSFDGGGGGGGGGGKSDRQRKK